MLEKRISVEKMVFGGAGLGRIDGKACFVPLSAPGDEAMIRIISEKRSYLEGELLDVKTLSPHRVQPLCPIFGKCGGCSWQHLSYAEQLSQKQEIFSDLVCRGGRFEKDRIAPIVGASEPYGYRARVQFKLRSVAGTVHIGFYRPASHYVVDIPSQCAIANPAINKILRELRPAMALCPDPERVPQIDVATGDDGSAILTFHYIGERYDEFVGFLYEVGTLLKSVGGIFVQRGRKSSIEKVSGVDCLRYVITEDFLPGMAETKIAFSGGGFSQVNYRQNLELLTVVHHLAKLSGSERILDLFCGNGNFSLPLARYAARVHGMEAYEPSILDAKRNSQTNGIMNTSFECIDALDGVQKLAARGERFDVILLDPPRTGAADVVSQLHDLNPRSIIYVSCDPATLGRDIGVLMRTGYNVVESRPVDMFPQTYHIESVTLLERAN